MKECGICYNDYSGSHCPTCGAFKVGHEYYHWQTLKKMTRAKGAISVGKYRRYHVKTRTEMCDARN